ncbi:hypothetical protein FXI20_24570 [Escherichia coli]|nr:hypothetical protein [Escherichia coli]EFB9808785.1 hypothetical protein [Escherichia coli]EFD0346929.1 hypothetical protein [Escherichia coli]
MTKTKRVRLILMRFFLKCHKNSMREMRAKIPVQNFPPRGRKLVILTCSPFGTVEIDRASLSCIVMQPSKNDSGAFFWFGLVFSCLFAFFAPESD